MQGRPQPTDLHQICATHVTRPSCMNKNLHQTNDLIMEAHRTETSVAVCSIEQNELIVEIHRAETSVAVRSNQQNHWQHLIDNCIWLLHMFYDDSKHAKYVGNHKHNSHQRVHVNYAYNFQRILHVLNHHKTLGNNYKLITLMSSLVSLNLTYNHKRFNSGAPSATSMLTSRFQCTSKIICMMYIYMCTSTMAIMSNVSDVLRTKTRRGKTI